MNLLFKLSGLFYKLHLFFFKKAKENQQAILPLSEINKKKWYQDKQEEILRYNYTLSPDSIVMDVGGYEGDFAAEIFARYQSTIYVFEPVERYITYLKDRFKNNSSIIIIPEGLGAKKETLQINVMEEASSYERSESIHKKGQQESISIMNVEDFFVQFQIKKVDLIKINIEGAEYDLLDKMIEMGFIAKCVNIQVQFHDFYDDFEKRYLKIIQELEKTHKLTYSYPFVWENWQLK